MKKRLLLAAVLLAVSFCLVSGAEYGVGSEKDSVSATDQAFLELLKARTRASRYTFLVVPMDKDNIKYALSMLESFLDIYSDPEIPQEFAYIFPTGIRAFLQDTKLRSKVREYSWIESLLLTMAYQQGYKIEYVTSSYVILTKFVDKEELKE